MEHSEMNQDYSPESPDAGAPQPLAQHRFPADQRRRRGHPYKSPLLASFLSIMPGLGQVYVGYYQRGFTNIAVVALTITALASNVGGLAPLLGVMLAFFWIYNIIDAGRRATLLNAAVDGMDGIAMPKDIKSGESGSIFGGVILVGLGTLIFLNTRFDISMAWLQEWWPLAIISIGAFLIYKAVQSRREGA